jgi:hypothetical protein
VCPCLYVVLGDLEWDDASLIDKVGAAFPDRRVTWETNGVTIAGAGFGGPVTLMPARYDPDERGLVWLAVNLAEFDARGEKVWNRAWARCVKASVDLADRVRPMLMSRTVDYGVEGLHDAPPHESSYLFRGGWACVDRMDERRANGFRRALDGVEHRVTPNGVA